MTAPLGSSCTRRAKNAGIAIAILMLAFVSTARAVPVAVPNASFELPNGGVGNPDGGQATGWTANGGAATGGVSYFSFGFTAAAQGTQFHWLNLPAFGGPNPSVTQSNPTLIGNAQVGTYRLVVAGGRRNNDATTDGKYVIELLAGGSVIGSQTVDDPFDTYVSGTWNDITTTATVLPGDVAVGKDLSIRLSVYDGTGGIRSQGQFDNVRLYFTGTPTTLLLKYDPVGSQSGNIPLAPSFAAPGVAGTALSQTGLEAWGNTNVWPVGRILSSPAIPLGEYIQFTVSPQNGAAIAFKNLLYDKVSYLGTGATKATIRSSVDGYAADVSTVAVNPAGAQSLSFDISGLPTTLSPVTFRIYFYGALVDLSDWDDLVSTAGGANGLRVTGMVGNQFAFSFTGGEQTFVVPAGVTHVHVEARGAVGGGSPIDERVGGRGAAVSGDIPVTPGSTLYVEVGGTGTTDGCYPGTACNSGFNGGGSGGHFAGGGGGASDVRTVSIGADPSPGGAASLNSRLIVAAGGGGGGEGAFCGSPGGNGGDAEVPGAAGQNCGYPGGNGGGAATISAGGAGSGGPLAGGPGALGIGGSSPCCGGGGGGGLYGGGAGGNITFDPVIPGNQGGGGGGGGGSNLVPVGGTVDVTSDPARVTITIPSLVGVERTGDLPRSLELATGVPNPFGSRTRFAYTLPRAARVSLTVYDVQGRQVARLADGEQSAGRHAVEWGGRNQDGQPLRAGVYLVRLTSVTASGYQFRERNIVLVR